MVPINCTVRLLTLTLLIFSTPPHPVTAAVSRSAPNLLNLPAIIDNYRNNHVLISPDLLQNDPQGQHAISSAIWSDLAVLYCGNGAFAYVEVGEDNLLRVYGDYVLAAILRPREGEKGFVWLDMEDNEYYRPSGIDSPRQFSPLLREDLENGSLLTEEQVALKTEGKFLDSSPSESYFAKSNTFKALSGYNHNSVSSSKLTVEAGDILLLMFPTFFPYKQSYHFRYNYANDMADNADLFILGNLLAKDSNLLLPNLIMDIQTQFNCKAALLPIMPSSEPNHFEGSANLRFGVPAVAPQITLKVTVRTDNILLLQSDHTINQTPTFPVQCRLKNDKFIFNNQGKNRPVVVLLVRKGKYYVLKEEWIVVGGSDLIIIIFDPDLRTASSTISNLKRRITADKPIDTDEELVCMLVAKEPVALFRFIRGSRVPNILSKSLGIIKEKYW